MGNVTYLDEKLDGAQKRVKCTFNNLDMWQTERGGECTRQTRVG